MSFIRSDWFPDVPALSEVVTLTPEQANWLRVASAFESTRVVLLPPGVPQDRVDFVTDAVWKMFQEAAFIKQAKRVWPIWSEYQTGEEYLEIAKAAAAIPLSEIAGLQEIVKEMSP